MRGPALFGIKVRDGVKPRIAGIADTGVDDFFTVVYVSICVAGEVMRRYT
jgi:hypothetical protein